MNMAAVSTHHCQASMLELRIINCIFFVCYSCATSLLLASCMPSLVGDSSHVERVLGQRPHGRADVGWQVSSPFISAGLK